ncbi:replication initiation protein, partial [Thermococcus sp.]|uniref:replication initiation protein n=1 Tax=Thermococcus sp. TaxID=35749 RepID=UPI0026346BAF
MVYMGKKGKPWRVREPNLLIEAKQKMTREELLVWAWCLANARFWITDGDGRELSLEELEEIRKKQEVFYAVSEVELEELRRRFPDHFSPRKVKYWREVLKGMEKKIVFEVNCEAYKQVLEDLGFTYILEKFVKKKDPTYCGIATIMGVFYSEPKGDLQVVYTPLVAPLLVLLKKWFTIYNFEEILNLDLKASIVLYRIFKEKLSLKRNDFELSKEALIELLDLKKVSGKDLARKYIEPAVKEINEKTHLKVEVEQIRRGRGRGGKIVGFRFRVEEEPRPEEATTKDLVENFDVLKKWFKKTIEQLAEELSLHKQVSPAEIARSL